MLYKKRMKKIICVILLSVLLIGFVLALELPPEHMAFYGTVTYSNGTIPNQGYYIIAKINGNVNGQCEITDGKYGYGQACKVITPSTGGNIEFYLGYVSLGSHSFDPDEIVNLNFTATVLPTNFTPLSNGICEPLKNECSYNLLDCDASKTNICAGNGRCDAEIGETCTLTSQDCGTCQTSGGGSSGGGSSSGGSGGGSGGGGGGGSPKTTTSSNSGLTTLSTGNSETEENGTIDLKDTEEKNNRITGNAISDFTKSTGGKISIVILILAIIVLVLASVKKKKKGVKVVKLSEMKK